MTEVDYSTLKKSGFMRQVQQDRFSLRLRVVGGQIGADQLAKLSEIAEKYGHGYIHLTSRQGIEIPFVSIEHIDRIKNELAAAGLQPGSSGARMRTITACQGSAICPRGLIETTEFAQELDCRYFGQDLPYKFKLGITGCKNNCLKAEGNDLGIKGGLLPEWDHNPCTYCGLCQYVCPAQAIKVDRGKSAILWDKTCCMYCGKCVKTCPVGAWKGKNGYLLFFGGTFGNEIKLGVRLLPLLLEKTQVVKAVDTAIAFFQTQGHSGERFGKTIARTGSALLQRELEKAL